VSGTAVVLGAAATLDVGVKVLGDALEGGIAVVEEGTV
jgi:hypothetical protein